MTDILFSQVNYALEHLLSSIKLGIIGLPEIQRPFVWPNAKVRDLFDSMYRGFPVGYLLFWQNGLETSHKPIGIDDKQKVPISLIVDGQQRLTSLYAVMKGIEVIREDFRKEKILISFNPLTETFAVYDAAIGRNPEFLEDISVIWSKGIFKAIADYLIKLKASREVSDIEEKFIQENLNKVDNIRFFPFTVLDISSAANEEQVSEIFVRVNSKGTLLNQADFILTLMSVFWEDGRKQLEGFCRLSRIPSSDGKPSPYNHFIQPDPDHLLRTIIGFGFKRARLKYAYLILRGKDLETEQYSPINQENQFQILKSSQERVLNLTNWHDFLKAVLLAGYVSEQMISSKNSLMYSYVFFLIGKYDYQIQSSQLRRIISRWFAMSTLTSRYTGSFESSMEQDLGRLREIKTGEEFINLMNQLIDEEMTEDYWSITLPNQLDTSSASSPALFAYYAALVKLDAPVLFSELKVAALLNPSINAKKAAVERHHLFPKSYLNKIGINEIRDTNQIANFALVEWAENVEISDDPPSKYYPKYEGIYPPEKWKEYSFLHALPENWFSLPYPEFLSKRRYAIARVIRKGFGK